MKKILIVLCVITLSFVTGCGVANVNADEKAIFTYIGNTMDNKYGVSLYRYEDKEKGKIIYVTCTGMGGTGIAVVDDK
jgi:hypothetical protein